MDGNLYEAAVSGNVSTLGSMSTNILQQVSPQENTVAHMAASLGHYKLVELLYDRSRSLLYKKNSHGDTPLHVAARDAQESIVQFIIENCQFSEDIEMGNAAEVEEEKEPLTRKRNREGNTALHEAMQRFRIMERTKEATKVRTLEKIVKTLVEADPRLIHLRNKEGNSPASLAAEANRRELLEFMLGFLHDSSDVQQWEGGKTPLHSAILRGDQEIMKAIVKLKPQLIGIADSKGMTPLHLVSFKGDLDGAIELLKLNTSVVYQGDKIGYFPIHIAAHMGRVDIIKHFVENYPGSWELLTVEKENILHVAVKSGNENVLRYILKTPKLEKLLNEKQKEGNTPLHLATMDWLYKFVYILASDARIDLSLTNDDNLTALDIAETQRSMGVATFTKATTLIALYNVGAPRSMNHRHIIEVFKQSTNDFQWCSMEYYNGFIDSLLVVSSLVLTVTFTAGFTIPGGFNSDNPDKGMAVFLKNKLFQVFVTFDTIAMYLAVIVVISLIWARTGHVKLANMATNISLVFLGTSLTMMSVSFTAGLCLVTGGISWLASMVLALSFIFLACMGGLFLASVTKIWSRFGLNMMMNNYNLHIWLSAARHKWWLIKCSNVGSLLMRKCLVKRYSS